MSVRTYSPKPGDVTREWFIIDAQDVVLGRLAVESELVEPSLDLRIVGVGGL